MPEPRAQRTLVKSPPELWAEISDVSLLARRLGEFGDVRITEVKAETTVAWEGDRARGTVSLEPSGWGTKVTITAEALAPPPERDAAEVVGEVTEAEPEPAADPVVEEAAPPAIAEPKRGFFARLFGRRAKPTAITAPTAVVSEPATPAEPPVAAPPIAAPELDGEIAASAPAFDAEHVEAVLVGVLDDLGSAHHRPFSRG